ncbi:IlvD/Edd family dehydratase [Epibacterium sp. Ofav1-8]|uniref:IlvD/Edd family dehydratase n=1 Tax=Epibacterium sp. Ofav1-8 TaxID=2917735 RepID=UPI001EF59DD7|nr:IlvD/Edd family dehydratase [Epibacterium sp. Ofav1-8]MCG7625081.1 dihydroxy-acid dehydratase family protein [Epibacterium sp. Ofav1-8]
MAKQGKRLRSQDWFDSEDRLDMTALYLERFMNYGITPGELREGRPIIAIAQSGSDMSPCNRVHLELERRVRDGIRDAGGIALSFPTHPIFENCRRPTAALDRNLAYLGLVEILNGYPIDGVVLTTGCDKTTPSAIMAALTVNIPAIVLNGGPMLNGWAGEERVGSGTVIWRARRAMAAGEIDGDAFLDRAAASAPSVGHCNTMGTASTMNAVAEALGLTLPGAAAIPAPYRERGQMAYRTGKAAVDLVQRDLRPLDIVNPAALRNAIRVISAIGGSTNAQPHLTAIAAHAGHDLPASAWQEVGLDIPLLANVQPAGTYLSEDFHRAGGVPAVMAELNAAGLLEPDCLTVNGQTLGANLAGHKSGNSDVIRPVSTPLAERAGFVVMRGNFFDFAIMKTSVISPEFRARFLSDPEAPNRFRARAVIFDGGEDYHHRINDPALDIDAQCILVMRHAGPLGWPGSAEVVNMQPPDRLITKGIASLPSIGDGRQSGTSDSPSILHVCPEASTGGGLALLRDGDWLSVNLAVGCCDLLVSAEELAARRAATVAQITAPSTPWEAIFQRTTTSLSEGMVIRDAPEMRNLSKRLPKHNH